MFIPVGHGPVEKVRVLFVLEKIMRGALSQEHDVVLMGLSGTVLYRKICHSFSFNQEIQTVLVVMKSWMV